MSETENIITEAESSSAPPQTEGAQREEDQQQYLSKEEVAALDDDEFYAAYRAGKIRRREDAWTEENFEEEIEKIPLFMTKEPTPKDFAENPHLQAMQQVFEENLTPLERAEYHKDHGNKAFKKGRAVKNNWKLQKSHFKKAIECYTEGLLEKCEDKEMESTLLSNRAAVNLQLKNNRKVIEDCITAIAKNPNNIKAYYRAAQAFFNVSRYDEAIEMADEGLAVEPTNETIIELRKNAVKKLAAKRKEERKAEALQRREEKRRQQLIAAVEKRGIQWGKQRPIPWWEAKDNEESKEQLESLAFNEQRGHPRIDEDGQMYWPVLFVYPEHGQTDFIEQFCEAHTFMDHLLTMFPNEEQPAVPWDIHNQYKAKNIALYFEENKDTSSKIHKINANHALGRLLQDKRHTVYGWTVVVVAVVAGSAQEQAFLERYSES